MKSNHSSSTGRSTHISYPSDHADASTSSEFPDVPYDDPAWGDPDRWVLGPWLPEGAMLVPSGNGFARMVRRTPRSKGVKRHGRL